MKRLTIRLSFALLLAGLTAGAIGFQSCTSSSFSGASAGSKAHKGGNDDDDDDDDDDTSTNTSTSTDDTGLDPDTQKVVDSLDQGQPNPTEDQADGNPIRIFGDQFKGAFLIKKLDPEQKNYVWAVTMAGSVYYFKIEGNAVTQTKKWTGITGGAGGARTYVTEGGLVVAKSGGYLYFIDPNSPEGPVSSFFRLVGPNDSERVCIVSYRKDKKRYVGMGWGNGHFIEYAMADAAPYAPMWGTVTGQVDMGTSSNWGYSCYIDQERLIYYSQFGGGPYAVDLKTMTAANANNAPNGVFTSANISSVTVGPRQKASYAMAGDRRGNVLNGNSIYTMTHDAKSDAIFASNSGNLSVYPAKCLSTEPNCVGQVTFNQAQVNANVGPISALGDGRIAGMARGGNGQVYLIGLKNIADWTQGLDVTRIAELDGDPYMYTDFTGATLYLTTTENTFNLDEKAEFSRTAPVKAIGFSWVNRPGSDAAWKDIKLEVRCYASNSGKGEYEVFDKVKDALNLSFLTTPSCIGKSFDRVDVRLTQVNNGDSLMNVRKVQLTAYQ